MLMFNSSQLNDCVNVDLLNDSSIEGLHSFTVTLDVPALPTINTTGSTDIVIEDVNGEQTAKPAYHESQCCGNEKVSIAITVLTFQFQLVLIPPAAFFFLQLHFFDLQLHFFDL